ncbi:MAG: hypothetical protein K0S33_3403 [Bacteroidetes bacterium]|jgi:hypothetical protein|nr:hypothetical protein [Bacteroidota bacterium]
MNKLVTYIKYSSIVVFAFVVFTGCKHKKHVQETVPVVTVPDSTESDRCKLDFKSGKVLAKNMKDNELDFKYASAKFSCDLTLDNEDHSFSVSVRCKKDSVIWLSISKLGIDAARALITKDSVKIMMGLTEKKYFKGDYTYINDLLKSDLDYDMIQALLFGNSAAFYDDDDKLKPGKDKVNCNYFLSTVKKRTAKKINSGQLQPDENYQTIWLSPTTYKIVMLEYDDVKTKRKFNACYEDFRPVDKFLAPFKLTYSITAEKIIKADIRYNKINLNEEQTFPFKIPASYEPIQIRQNNDPDPNKTGG